ncbi:MAG: putative Efflux transporter, permease protein [Candidatus Saccharibacteria bacterium]|nr:putative Efflux transporter, permease protein [Candidatus Saccharibacteria bacterium]
MSMGSKGHFKLAVSNLRHNRMRSLLTILGITIGITSIILVIAIGEGIKRQVQTNNAFLGNDIITVQPSQSGNPLQPSLTALTQTDAQAIAKLGQVSTVVPLAAVSGTVSAPDSKPMETMVIAAGDDVGDIFGPLVEYGDFSGADTGESSVAVIGTTVAARIFGEQVPLGREFRLRGQHFIVQGVLKDVGASTLSPAANLNNAIIIPFKTGQKITNANLPVYQILVRIKDREQMANAVAAINDTVLAKHGNQADFTVLGPGDSASGNDKTITTITYAIAAIAAISLLVGGIGVMNVMWVSVTERMQEIGIRKAVGATNRQILTQFIVEATVVSVAGGVAGVAVAYAIEGIVLLFSDFKMPISWPVPLIAFFVTLVLGLLFGTAPALKASRKDPIEALRNA